MVMSASAFAPAAQAYDAWGALRAEFPADDENVVNTPAEDNTVTEALTLAEPAEQDWGLLALPADITSVASATIAVKRRPRPMIAQDSAWSQNRQNDGTAAVTVTRSLASFWDAQVGADMSVARIAPVASTSDRLLRQFGTEQTLAQSGGSAWVQMTAPGATAIWDRAVIEARLDPGQNQNRWGTSFVKAVPLGSADYALTLHNNFNIVQQGSGGGIEADQLARLSLQGSGTSFIAGQTHSSADDKWLRRIGAEQKIFGNVKISGSISETAQGPSDKALFASYNHRW